MVLFFATLATVSISIGTVLTRPLMKGIPQYEPIGPLFLLNGLVAVPFMAINAQFELPNIRQLFLLLLIGSLTTAGAFLVFFIINRSTPATSLIGQSLSPVPLLFLNLLIFGERFSPVTGGIALLMVTASAFAIGGSMGTRSGITLVLILCQSSASALIAILISRLIGMSFSLYEIVVWQQFISAFLALAIKPPKNFTRSLLPIYTVRSLFMSLGWIFTALSLKTHHLFESQVILSLTPLVATYGEQIQSKSKSHPRLWISGIIVFVCVLYIHIFSLH